MERQTPSETTLAEHLGAAPLRPRAVARIGRLACLALASAPGARRDLGPLAIVLETSPEGVVRVTVRRPAAAGTSSRSPMYVSPEHATHTSSPDARSEVYSLCMVCYEALSGALPLPRCETLGELLTVLVTQDPRPLAVAAPWVDPGLVRVIERGLQREPARRWASPDELAEALLPFTGGSDRLTPSMLGELPAEDRIPRELRPGSPRGAVPFVWAVVAVFAGVAVVAVAAVRFATRAGGAPSDRRDAGPPFVESPTAARSRSPEKREVASTLLGQQSSFFVHLDPRRPGVLVPASLTKQPRLVLQVGRALPVPIPDLDIGTEGITATLSFKRQPFTCKIPWIAVFGLVGEDGRGQVWDDDTPPEVIAERAKKQDTGPP
jgi:hypothetical protein